ncbi:MAG: hypothetical protein ACD_63C00037G0001, partial [uncultured bacterium]
FVGERKFEKSLLRTLEYIETNCEKDALDAFVARIQSSRIPFVELQVSEQSLMQTQSEQELASYRPTENKIEISGSTPDDALFSALLTSMVVGTPSSNEAFRGLGEGSIRQDMRFSQGMMAYLARVGVDVDPLDTSGGSYQARVFMRELIDAGYMSQAVRAVSFDPDMSSVDKVQTALVRILYLKVPHGAVSRGFYAILLDIACSDASAAKEDLTSEQVRAWGEIFELADMLASESVDLESLFHTIDLKVEPFSPGAEEG